MANKSSTEVSYLGQRPTVCSPMFHDEVYTMARRNRKDIIKIKIPFVIKMIKEIKRDRERTFLLAIFSRCEFLTYVHSTRIS